MTAEIRKVAWSQAAFGYRRITATLRRQDWRLKDELVPQAQPYDNGHREIFHRSLREELLDAELFHSLEEARVQGGNRLNWSNRKRPPQGLDYRTPGEVWPEVVSAGCLGFFFGASLQAMLAWGSESGPVNIVDGVAFSFKAKGLLRSGRICLGLLAY